MSLADFNRTILDYLVWSGQEEAAISFWEETGGEAPFDMARASAVLALKQAVRDHDFIAAWQRALEIDAPQLLEQPELEVCFALAQIVKALMAKDPPLGVIEQARHTVSPLIAKVQSQPQRAKFELLLEHLVSLLILPQWDPPAKRLLAPGELEKWVLAYVQEFLQAKQPKHNLLATYVALNKVV